MFSDLRQFARAATACILVTIFAVPSNLMAEAHVVSSVELQKEMLASTQLRQHNLESVRQFLSTPVAERTMKSAHMDPTQVKTAVSLLSDQELAQLASRSAKAQADFAAGDINDHDLLIIILGIAALALIIVAVHR